jgi:quercetin dioxygenase-like cupin family protein
MQPHFTRVEGGALVKNRHHLPYESLKRVPRGQGIINHLISSKLVGARVIHSGITELPPGAAVPAHTHNAEEQVTVLQGILRIRIDDLEVTCKPYDSTFISAGVDHEFSNVGDDTALVMVIYGSVDVTRTFSGTGETVAIGSERDRFSSGQTT